VLHLQHGALARLIGTVRRLGDHPIETGALELLEPPDRGRPVSRHGGQVEGWPRAGQQDFEAGAALALRRLHQALTIGGEQVERHERRGRLLRQLRHPRGRGMQPELERIEIEPVRRGDHDFPVDHTVSRQLFQERVVQIGEIAVERAEVAALDEQVGRAAKDDGAESVPFRLEKDGPGGGQCVGQLGEHRLDRRRDREGGAGTSSAHVG
jgi:hypothetical protein